MRNRLVLKLEREEDESTWLKVRKNDNPSFVCCICKTFSLNDSLHLHSTRQSIEDSMIKHKVTANTMATYGTVPTTGQCAKNDVGCPTLEMWCDSGDASPLCGPTPYIEETTVNAGVVAGNTVAVAFVVIAAVTYFMQSLHKKKMAAEKERLKNEFARRIVGTFSVGSGGEAITMEKITEEFQRIDSGSEGGDGRISKAVSTLLKYILMRKNYNNIISHHAYTIIISAFFNRK